MGILKQMPIPYIERQHMDIKINTAKKKRRKYRFVSVVSILVFLGIWYIATAVLELVPAYSLPSPVKVFSTLITKLYTQAPDGATLPQHFLASLQVATYGYVLGRSLACRWALLWAGLKLWTALSGRYLTCSSRSPPLL